MKKLPCGHIVNDPDQVHYCQYLHVDELLQLQPSAEEVIHPDEHLFVVTHQAFELWFNQLRFDMKRIIEAIQKEDLSLATWLVRRCVAIVKQFTPMIRVLETMTPSDFFAFRAQLAPASGSESAQWHEIEILAGARDEPFRRHLMSELSDDPNEGTQSYLWTDRLNELWKQPSIASAFRALLERRGVTPSDLYVVAPEQNRNAELMLLAEHLLDFDEEVKLWRFAHARTAERAIGPTLGGTGHTTGVRYLDYVATHRAPFFPELWEARSELWKRQMENRET